LLVNYCRRRARKIRSRSNYVIDGGVHGNLNGTLSCRKHPSSSHLCTPIYKPSAASGRAGGRDLSLPTFRNLNGTWQRTRPLPTPNCTDDDRDDLIAMTPLSATAELPLLSSYESDNGQVTPSMGYPTFGPGYHEQCINLLRRSNPSWLAHSKRGGEFERGVGVDINVESSKPEGVVTSRGFTKEPGPYYFKLDLNGGHAVQGGHGQEHGPMHHCVMCQANNSTLGRRSTAHEEKTNDMSGQ